MMKKIFLVLIFVLSAFVSVAQEPSEKKMTKQERQEEFEALRVGYFTDKLSLTVEQSQAFWPLFKEYDRAVHDVFRARKKYQRQIQSSVATEADIEKWLDFEETISEIRDDYAEKFMKIISADQTAKLFVAEEGFKQQLIRSLRKGKF